MERTTIKRLQWGKHDFDNVVIEYQYYARCGELPEEQEGIDEITVISCTTLNDDGDEIDGKAELTELLNDWRLESHIQEIVLEPKEEE